MPHAAKYITIEGQFASGVLGTFRIIRGFATLQDLAAISAPFPMNTAAATLQPITGHQRAIDPAHADAIKRYLQDGKPRYIPEIILSIRAEFRDELDPQLRTIGVVADSVPGLTVKRRWKSRNIATHQIIVDKELVHIIVQSEQRIRRIDGNHRLHLADQLRPDAGSRTKYLAPFCAILLGPPGDANDDYDESMLFHTINSTALPLDSEHALQLVLSQPAAFLPSADEEFASNAPLHFTRLLKAKIDRMPVTQRARLGTTPATVLNSAANALVSKQVALSQDRSEMEKYAEDLSGAITDILARLPANHPELCKADFFIELASLAWSESDFTKNRDTRINQAVAMLEGMGRWLGRDGMHQIQSKRSIAQQFMEIYRSLQSRIPKKVFLARWYPTEADGDEKNLAELRLSELKKATNELGLELIDMGSKEGGTYQIPPAMYQAIDSSDIMLADLTGIRPNVMIEVGYALRGHPESRMLLYYDTRSKLKVPFDIAGFKYIPISDAAEIHNKLKPSIKAIIDQAKAALI